MLAFELLKDVIQSDMASIPTVRQNVSRGRVAYFDPDFKTKLGI